MPKNRINYPVEALYVGPTPSTGSQYAGGAGGIVGGTGVFYWAAMNSGASLVKQLYRIQSCNYDFNIPRTPVNQMGETAAIDQVILTSPAVNLNFTYLLAGLVNESGLGFNIDGTSTMISGMLTKVSDDKNYYLKINPEGVEAVSSTTNTNLVTVMGVGNGFISNYSVQAAVGGFPTVSIAVQGLNMGWTTGISAQIPAVNPNDGSAITGVNFSLPTALSSVGTGSQAVTAIRPGDITMTLTRNDGGPVDYPGATFTDAKLQSFNLAVDLTREEINKLGSKLAFAREIRFPVNTTLSIDALVGDLTTGSLQSFIQCDSDYNVQINMLKPDCTSTARPRLVTYKILNANLQSANYSSNLTNNKTVTLTFIAQMGGVNQTGIGIFSSGNFLD